MIPGKKHGKIADNRQNGGDSWQHTEKEENEHGGRTYVTR